MNTQCNDVAPYAIPSPRPSIGLRDENLGLRWDVLLRIGSNRTNTLGGLKIKAPFPIERVAAE